MAYESAKVLLNNNYKKGKKEKKCVVCGKKFNPDRNVLRVGINKTLVKHPKISNGSNKYCSEKCEKIYKGD